MVRRAGRLDPAARPWPLARLVRQRAQLPVPLALAAVAITVAVTGCATAPSGGPPRSAPGGSNQVQAYVQQLPAPGPTSKWKPTEVVLGFLHASASYVFDPAAAEQYLVPTTRTQWQPGLGPVAVVGAPTGFQTLPYRPQILGPVQAAQVEVQFTGQHLATLSQTGQYQYAPAQNVRYDFVLEKTNDVWLIEQLPSLHTLLLTESDFEDVYQPRNLFFYAPPAAGQAPSVLVPDPVYAPLQSSNSALNTDLATGLVNGLLKGQGGWLSGATVSAFPRGTRLLKKVVITGRTAVVDLGGAAVHAQFVTVQQMAAQLLATLSDGEYPQPLATRLELYIGKTPKTSSRRPDWSRRWPPGQCCSSPVRAASTSCRPRPGRGLSRWRGSVRTSSARSPLPPSPPRPTPTGPSSSRSPCRTATAAPSSSSRPPRARTVAIRCRRPAARARR